MSVRDTSIESHQINEAAGIHYTLNERITAYVAMYGPVTRRMIATALNLDTATVSGRVRELVKMNLLQDGEKAPCPITKRRAYQVSVRPKAPTQGELI